MCVDRSWEIFSGLISEVCLNRVQQSMQALEGLLRSLPMGTAPDIESCVAAVARARSWHADENDRAWFGRLRLAAVSCQQVTPARDDSDGAACRVRRLVPPVIGNEAHAGAHRPWYAHATQAVLRFSCSMRVELLGLTHILLHGVQTCQRVRSHGFLLVLRRRGSSLREGNRNCP